MSKLHKLRPPHQGLKKDIFTISQWGHLESGPLPSEGNYLPLNLLLLLSFHKLVCFFLCVADISLGHQYRCAFQHHCWRWSGSETTKQAEREGAWAPREGGWGQGRNWSLLPNPPNWGPYITSFFILKKIVYIGNK